MQKLLLPLSACFLILLTTACAPPVRDRFFWPAPPQEPKVEFIGIYRGQSDVLTGFSKTFNSMMGGSMSTVRQPTAVAADGQSRVFTSDSELNKIVVFDFANEISTDYITDGLKMPFGLDVDSKDNLYVVERKGASVQVFDSTAHRLFSFGQRELSEPIRIAVDEVRGRIYVSDRKDQQVKVFNLKGEFIQAIGGEKGVRSAREGEFNSPNDLDVDQAGNLYVCDQLNARIAVFDPSGVYLRQFGDRGDKINNFEAPMGIAFDNSGNLWISDIRKGAISYFGNPLDPQFQYAILGPADTPGLYNLRSPMDIFIDKNNRIFVADGLARRLAAWQILDPPYLTQHPLPANWMQRTDILERWYKESGEFVPGTDPEKTP